MTAVLAIFQIISQLLPQIAALGSQAIAAHTAGDQATLDAIHDRAVAMAEAMKPDGA
jgi:hypothetical protein